MQFLINEERSFKNTKKAIAGKYCLYSSAGNIELFPDVKFLNDGPVTLDIGFFQVIEYPSSFANKTYQSALCSKIFLINFLMFGKVGYSLGE